MLPQCTRSNLNVRCHSGSLRGYGKCVCGNQQKPNVNHFFIADATLSPNIQHIISTDTNDDMHELRGIGPGSPLAYVLYASENGVCHWDEDNEKLFLAAVQSCTLLSFGCSQEASRIVPSLNGKWSVDLNRISQPTTNVWALRTAPYAVCLNDTFHGGVITKRSDEIPAGARIFVHSCPQCQDMLFMAASRVDLGCSNLDNSSTTGAEFSAMVAMANWSALDGSENRDDFQLGTMGDIGKAVNGADNLVRYRTGPNLTSSAPGFQVDLRLDGRFDIDGVSIMVHPVLNQQTGIATAVGYSGIEIFVSHDGGENYKSVFIQQEMFGSYDRPDRTTFTLVASNYADNQWTAHAFEETQINVTDVRIITGAADQVGDNCVSFNSIRVDSAGAYDPDCLQPTVCPSGFYIAEVPTEWLALITMEFAVHLPAGAKLQNASVFFGAPSGVSVSNTSDMKVFPVTFEILVDNGLSNVSLVWSPMTHDLRQVTDTVMNGTIPSSVGVNTSQMARETIFETPDISTLLQHRLDGPTWVPAQTIAVQFGLRKNQTHSPVNVTDNFTKWWLQLIPNSTTVPRIEYSAHFENTLRVSHPSGNCQCICPCLHTDSHVLLLSHFWCW